MAFYENTITSYDASEAGYVAFETCSLVTIVTSLLRYTGFLCLSPCMSIEQRESEAT